MINLGYACINTKLQESEGVTTNRSMIKRTFQAKGISYASELALLNCRDLYKVIEWNSKNGITLFRMSSDIFPWNSEYKLSDLKDYKEIKLWLERAGKLALKHNIRLSFHPGHFCILASPSDRVIQNTIKDLNTHGEIMDLLCQSRTPYNKINIHVGGVYGDKESALNRFCENFELLDDSAKTRLTVENDDKASMYSVKDLYHGVYEKIGIPIVFDYYHHKFCTGDMSEQEALELAIKSWPIGITPTCHYSESRRKEYKDETIKEQAHSDFCLTKIQDYGHDLDIMMEAKLKEQAVFKYRQKYDLI